MLPDRAFTPQPRFEAPAVVELTEVEDPPFVCPCGDGAVPVAPLLPEPLDCVVVIAPFDVVGVVIIVTPLIHDATLLCVAGCSQRKDALKLVDPNSVVCTVP